MRLRLVSGLFASLPFLKLEVEIVLNEVRTGWWKEFHSAHKALEYNTMWRGDEKVTLSGSDLTQLERSRLNHEPVSADVRITLLDGKLLHIKDVGADPHTVDIVDLHEGVI